MGGFAGAPGAGGRLTRWAFAPADVVPAIFARTVLVLPAATVARLPPLRGRALADAAAGGARGVRRRQVLAALLAGTWPATDAVLAVDADGRRRLADAPFYASVSERAGWVAAALSPAPVGIDLESVAEAATATIVRDGVDVVDPADWPTAAGLWAAREATLKAMGRDLTRDPGGWRFAAGLATAAGCPPHRVETQALPGIVAAVAYVGG